MSTTILNFKKVEFIAESKEAAKEQMQEYFFPQGDATQKYRKWEQSKKGVITDRDRKEFMLDYLASHSKNCPGVGFLITVESAVSDTRNRPYKIESVKNEGKRKFKTTYVAIDNETGVTIGKWDTNKADALNAIKEMYKSGEYKGSGHLDKVKEVVEGEATVATFEYAPSKNTKNGKYIAFGIERD